MRSYIYALIDPQTHLACYVGKANQPHIRYKEHINNLKELRDDHPKRLWIEALQMDGLQPQMIVLEVVEVEDVQEAERRWVQHFELVNTLTNVHLAVNTKRYTMQDLISLYGSQGQGNTAHPQTFGGRARALREYRGYRTQLAFLEALANQTGITLSQGHWSGVENSDNIPNGRIIAAIADILDTTTDYLLLRTDDPSPLGSRK